MTAILGISAYYHDSAAALVVDGQIVAAAQEERFSRVKHDAGFPQHAIDYCLAAAGLVPEQLDYVSFYEKPLVKFERLLETYLALAPRGYLSFRQALPIWLRDKLHLPRRLRRGLLEHERRASHGAWPSALGRPYRGPLVFPEHHESHAASAFFPSPFDAATILTVDGVGEWATACIGRGTASRIELQRELRFPHSLGLLYSAFTYYCGFRVNSGEYKLMGLAPYGRPVYRDLILQQLLDLKPDGSFRVDQRYFRYTHGLTMTSPRLHRLFGGPPRQPEATIDERHCDVAASVQAVTDEIMLRMARHAHACMPGQNLVLAGGVALNCVANSRILEQGPFRHVWIQPASGDAGGALGAALLVWHQLLDMPRRAQPTDSMRGACLGPMYDDQQIARVLSDAGATFTSCCDDVTRAGAPAKDFRTAAPAATASNRHATHSAASPPAEATASGPIPRAPQAIAQTGAAVALAHEAADQQLCESVARLLAEGLVVGWFQARMEFGPRALGARSILADPRRVEMQSQLNLKIKFRESFRPFAPIVLAERAAEYFDLPRGAESPYMLLVAQVARSQRVPLSSEAGLRRGLDQQRDPRSTIPAVTHVDGSARVQTVDRQRQPLLHRLLQHFERLTGCPVLVNTSFNVRGEPIVATPEDAYRCFQATEMDALAIGHHLLVKPDQPRRDPQAQADYLARLAPD